MKQTDPFEIVTSAVVARSVLEPLGPSLGVQMSCEEAHDELFDALEKAGWAYDLVERVSLVYDGAELVGWYTEDMSVADLEDPSVGEVMQPIYASELLSADTAVFKLVRLLAERPKSGVVLFVLDQDAIIGTISPAMLRHPVFRLCLFALSLELEQASLSAAMVSPLESWNSLSQARRAKAQEVYNRVYGPNPSKQVLGGTPWGPLLASTMISDKGTIVAKRELLPDLRRSQVESLFAKVELVRNWCAHTRDSGVKSPVGRPQNVAQFIASRTEAISVLRAIAERKDETG